jgi:hypothetical protein
MPELILRPDRPSAFRRTVRTGKKAVPKTIVFAPGVAVEVTDAEYLELAADIGPALVEVDRDEKGRIRYVEAEPNPTALRQTMEMPSVANL